MANHYGSGVDQISPVVQNIVIVFIALACYNVLELTFIIVATFKRYSGLYFWSFLVATWGIPFHSAGFLTKYYASSEYGYLAATLISVGWVAMVTGQSMVLWSRLHLILRNQTRLSLILWMIIINAFVSHGGTIPMIYGSYSPNPEKWATAYSIMEKIQVSLFFVQEIIISGVYIFETIKLINLQQTIHNRRSSRLMNHLIFVNGLIVLLDMTILGLEYANQYEYQTAYKGFVYSAKLKLEFTILNKLVEMTTGHREASSATRSRTHPTTTTRNGIVLETFNGEQGTNHPGDVSYQAYARRGDATSADQRDPSSKREQGVMRTTEIVVQREQWRDEDSESMDGKSSSSTIGRSKATGTGGLSKSSSEVHLATRGY